MDLMASDLRVYVSNLRVYCSESTAMKLRFHLSYKTHHAQQQRDSTYSSLSLHQSTRQFTRLYIHCGCVCALSGEHNPCTLVYIVYGIDVQIANEIYEHTETYFTVPYAAVFI